MSRTITRRRRLLPWIPAILTVGAGVVSALGIALIPSATATSSTNTINVTAQVDAEVHIDVRSPCDAAPDNPGDPGAISFPTLTTAMDDTAASNTCRVDFGSNNQSGATLSIANSGNGGAPFFCTRTTAGDPTTACSATGSFADNATANDTDLDPVSATQGAFGAGSGAAPVGCTATANWATLNNKSPIPVAAATICTQSAIGTDGQYEIKFWADPGTSQPAGQYAGRATVTATAT